MAAEKGSTLSDAKRAIVFALCKRFSVDPKNFPSETIESCDIMSLLSNISKLSSENIPLKDETEVIKWITFATELFGQPDTWHATLKGLNEDLVQKAVLLGKGTQPSTADIIVYCALHPFVSRLSDTDMQPFANVMRWMDYIQNKEDFGGVLQKIVVNKPAFEYFCSNDTGKIDTGVNSNKGTQGSKSVDKKKGVAEEQASVDDKATVELMNNNKVSEVKKKAPEKEKGAEEKKRAPEKEKGTEEKKKAPEKESSGKDTENNITILNIQVGVVRKAWKHPSADSLLVEEIDLGDGNLRQVVSGLAKYYGPDDLTNRRVVLITNVKPGKLRDVMSAGLVLCASNQDHSAVEPLIPPEGAILGERISFSGYEGKPEDVLNPKKKQLEKITPLLYTDEKGVATYKGVPFMTSAGPCTSSISKASIK